MAELLLELFSEEIPARMQDRAAADLKRLVAEGLKANALDPRSIQTWVTPRRLILVADGVARAQPDVTEEQRGPRIDAPDRAIDGFLRSKGLTREQCEERETKKGTFLFAVIERKGRAAAEVLPEVLNKAVNALPWPKSMRWGDYDPCWVRPLQGILCLFDGTVLPLSYGPVRASNRAMGHRFMAPAVFEVADFADYSAKLRAAKVMMDAGERRGLIWQNAVALAEAEGLRVSEDKGLLQEVAGLVEWPVVLMGQIDETFMDVPPEVLTTAMRAHQKYFSVLDADGGLANRFIVVANRESKDGGTAIRAGNERVLRARLSDAKFFWDQDRKRPLASRRGQLEDIVFHARLGSLADKMQSVENLAVQISCHVAGADEHDVRRAVQLCKADLVTDMVAELPELQGIMGRYYARNDGETDAVAQAIADHYSPQGPGDICPTAPVSVAVALADKLHTLAGFWSIDEKPTGSKDPFALRRAALGVIRLILENKLRLPLRQVFAMAMAPFARDDDEDGSAATATVESLLAFFADRLKVHLKEQGIRHDLISAVFALGGEDDLVRLLARVEALRGLLDTDDGANLLVAYRRASNIVAIEEKKDNTRYDGIVETGLLQQQEEIALYEGLKKVNSANDAVLSGEDFVGAMGNLAALRPPVDAFFDDVTVNCEEVDTRANRLRLLSEIRAALGQVADFSQIEG